MSNVKDSVELMNDPRRLARIEATMYVKVGMDPFLNWQDVRMLINFLMTADSPVTVANRSRIAAIMIRAWVTHRTAAN